MRRNVLKYSVVVASLLAMAFVSGCGTDNKEGNLNGNNVAKVDEASCAQCHGSSYDSISGQPIYAGYVQSKHFNNATGTVVGCQDCHGGGAQHNGVGPIPFANPDSAGKCWGCHQNGFLGKYEANGKPTAIQIAHFYNITGAGVHPAMYATTNFQNHCTACHEPHNPIQGLGKEERRAWATSEHGEVNEPAWNTEDFKENSSCLRCHTTTGYINYVSSGFTNQAVFAPASDKGREVLACSACHTADSFAVRNVAKFTAPYNAGKSPKTFPSVGTSNLCIPCHAARESGDTVSAVTNFANSSFKNSHYKAAAATMYMSNAFITYTTLSAPVPSNNEGSAFTSTKSLDKTMLPDNLSVPAYGISGGTTSAHRKLGTPLIAGTEGYLPAGGVALTTNGPCVTCHMQADNPVAGDTAQNSSIPVPAVRTAHGHSLQIDNDTAQQLCLPCHADAPHLDGGDGAGNAIYTTVTTLAGLESAMLEPQSAAFQNGLKLVKQMLLVKYMIKFDSSAYPYFYDMQKDSTGKTAVTDWTRKNVAGVSDAATIALGMTAIPAGGFSQKQASRVMGACFNFNLLTREPGSYVHARTFTQRLVYDAVDFLDNNTMDFSALSTARALSAGLPVSAGLAGVFVGTNVNVYAANGTLATETMAWLSGTHYSAAQIASATRTTDLRALKLRP
jgi:hypothetical protein